MTGQQALPDEQTGKQAGASAGTPWYQLSAADALQTLRVEAGPGQGLKHDSSIHCDELVSIPKAMLTHFVGTLSPYKQHELDEALKAALGLI